MQLDVLIMDNIILNVILILPVIAELVQAENGLQIAEAARVPQFQIAITDHVLEQKTILQQEVAHVLR